MASSRPPDHAGPMQASNTPGQNTSNHTAAQNPSTSTATPAPPPPPPMTRGAKEYARNKTRAALIEKQGTIVTPSCENCAARNLVCKRDEKVSALCGFCVVNKARCSANPTSGLEGVNRPRFKLEDLRGMVGKEEEMEEDEGEDEVMGDEEMGEIASEDGEDEDEDVESIVSSSPAQLHSPIVPASPVFLHRGRYETVWKMHGGKRVKMVLAPVEEEDEEDENVDEEMAESIAETEEDDEEMENSEDEELRELYNLHK